MRAGFPVAVRGQRIGLLGGSFDPAHDGHVHITHEALKRLGLDQVWWLVTPGNPLKSRQPASMEHRIARARQLIHDPRVKVTDLEARLGTRYTHATLTQLQALYPQVRFVWLMGADNLVQFHRWDRWQDIMRMVPVAVMARPNSGLRGRISHTAQVFKGARIANPRALMAADRIPAWTFVDLPMHGASSSAIRAKGGWNAQS